MAEPQSWDELVTQSAPKKAAGPASWDELVSESTKDPGYLGEIGRGLKAGAQVQLPKMAGQALKFFGAEETGDSLIAGAEARNTPDLQESAVGQAHDSPFSVRGSVYEAATNAVPSLAPGAAGAALGATIGTFIAPGPGTAAGALIGYAAGSIASLPMFYGSQAQESYEAVKKTQLEAGKSEAEADAIANRTAHAEGAIEAGGELAADIIPFAKLFKPLARPAGKAAGSLVKDTLFPTFKQGVKTTAQTVGGEVVTEMAQQAGEDYVRKEMGDTGPGATWDETAKVIMPTALMSIIPGAGGAGAVHLQRKSAVNTLVNPEADPEARAKVALGVAGALKDVDAPLSRAFAGYAAEQIQAGKPIEIGDDALYLRAAEPVTTEDRNLKEEADTAAAVQDVAAATTIDEAIQVASEAAAEPVVNPAMEAIAGHEQEIEQAKARDLQAMVDQRRDVEAQAAIAESERRDSDGPVKTAMQVAFEKATLKAMEARERAQAPAGAPPAGQTVAAGQEAPAEVKLFGKPLADLNDQELSVAAQNHPMSGFRESAKAELARRTPAAPAGPQAQATAAPAVASAAPAQPQTAVAPPLATPNSTATGATPGPTPTVEPPSTPPSASPIAPQQPAKPVLIFGRSMDKLTRKELELSAKQARSAAQREAAAAEIERRDDEKQARPLSPAEETRRAGLRQQAAQRKRIDVDRDSLVHAVIKLGGISPKERLDITGDTKGDNPAVMGVGYLFSSTGTGTDDVATRLGQYGYLSQAELDDVDGGVQALKDKIADELRGARKHWSTSGQAYEREAAAQAAAEDAEALERERPAAWDTMSEEQKDAELDALFGADSREKPTAGGQEARARAPAEEVGQPEQAAGERQPGQDDEEVDGKNSAVPARANAGVRANQVVPALPNADGVRQRATRPDDGSAGSKSAGTQRHGDAVSTVPAARPALALSAQSEAGLKAKQAALDAAAKKKADEESAAEAKRKADAERGDFTLSGSDRAADANPNQGGLFGGAVAALRTAADAIEKAVAPKPEQPAAQPEKKEPPKPDEPKPMFSRAPARAEPFYSDLSRGIERASMKAAPAKGWQDYLRGLLNKGIKADEIEWSGVKDWLEMQTGKVTKDQVLDYLRENGVKVEETVLGGSDSALGTDDIRVRLDALGYDIETDENEGEVLSIRHRGTDRAFTGPHITPAMREQALKGMPMFSRQADNIDAYKLRRGEDKNGQPAFVNAEIIIARGRPDPISRGEGVRSYQWTLYDRTKPGEKGGRYLKVGELYADLTPGGKFEMLRSITIYSRFQGSGYGESVVASMLAHNGPGYRMGIENIQHHTLRKQDNALPFWQKLGTRLHNYATNPNVEINGDLELADYLRARGEKGKFSRDGQAQAAEAQSSGRQEGPEGNARAREAGAATGAGREGVSGRSSDAPEAVENARAYRRAPGRYETLATEDVRRLIAPILKNWGNAPEVKVISSIADAPEAVKRMDSQQREGGAQGEPEAFINAGTVYLVANGLSSEAAVVRALFHESFGHYGLKGVLGDRIVTVLNEVVKSAPKRVEAKAKEYGLNWEDKDAKLIAAEEVLAEIAQSRPTLGLVRRAIAIVRQFLRELGIKIDLSENDIINDFILPARRFVTEQRQGWTGTASSAFSRAPAAPGNKASWDAPEPSKLDNIIYTLQDKHVDTKRVVEAIRKTSKSLADTVNVYLQEELFHGRAAKKTQDFVDSELKPLTTEMAARGVKIDDFEKYLHARHAEEANEHIAARNPKLPDGGSGMETKDAKDYLAKLDPKQRAAFEALAKRVDAITKKTRQTMVDYGIESQETVDGWGQMFDHYVPLMREDMDGAPGIGQGFSVKGKSSKERFGSKRKVVDILANIAMQRERAIVRGEKNRVAKALVGLAEANPNEDFWKVDLPPKIKYLGDDGVMRETVDPLYKSRDNVVIARIPDPKTGEIVEHSVIFNEHDERAARMAQALKNLDVDDLGTVLATSAKITRYFSSINTQYNPVFGVINLTRDTQGALLNLSTTPLRGKKAEVLKHTISALRGIYIDTRDARAGKTTSSAWAQLWEEFQKEGGQTGYRDMFRTSKDRAEAIQREMTRVAEGKAKQFGRAVFDWLSDYNTAMENAVRLASYKVAKEMGISNQQAASIAKNLTVNFNRKGQITTQAGALYAFFNASVQGSARLMETLSGPAGKKIIAGGLTLGVLQALALAAAGFDDDEPPDFVRERNFVIPIGGKKYLTVPLPLGLHFLPNLGRIPTEYVLSGFRNPGKRVGQLFGMFADAFNPVGNAGLSLQTITPTAVDPLAALAENKDWTGKPIARQDFGLNVTPGHTRAKDTASQFSKVTSKSLNWLSGGTNFKPGIFSPTPDQIDYLIGQGTGGVGREIIKTEQTVAAAITGEDLPTHKIPLLGRFYGSADQPSAQANAFYTNLKALNEHQAEIKGRAKAGEPVGSYFQDNPEARLYRIADHVEREVSKLRQRKRELAAKDASKEVIQSIEQQINNKMTRFNENVKRLRDQPGA